jgi:hypothetical protein
VGWPIVNMHNRNYEMPFAFTGKIDKVIIELKPDANSNKSAT